MVPDPLRRLKVSCPATAPPPQPPPAGLTTLTFWATSNSNAAYVIPRALDSLKSSISGHNHLWMSPTTSEQTTSIAAYYQQKEPYLALLDQLPGDFVLVRSDDVTAKPEAAPERLLSEEAPAQTELRLLEQRIALAEGARSEALPLLIGGLDVDLLRRRPPSLLPWTRSCLFFHGELSFGSRRVFTPIEHMRYIGGKVEWIKRTFGA